MTISSRPSAERRSAGALLVLLLAGLFLVSGEGAAGAEEPLTFKERYERAVATFKSGQFDKAVEQFQELYQEKPLPILLFNLAQSHRKGGHPKEALDLYERFLREDPKTELRPETEGYINDMKAAIVADAEAKEKAEKEKAERDKELALAKALAEEPPPLGFDRSGQRLRTASRPLRLLKWVTLGAGVLAAGAGAALLALNGRPTCTLATGQELCPQQLDTLGGGIAGVAIGGALLAGAAAMFVVDYRQGKEQLSLGPIRQPLLLVDYRLSPDGARTALLSLSGRF